MLCKYYKDWSTVAIGGGGGIKIYEIENESPFMKYLCLLLKLEAC